MAASQKLALLGALCLLGLNACGEGLGECDPTMLGGSSTPGMVQYNDGQEIVATSCSSGRCHSEAATGEQRVGAPAELDFDVVASSSTPEELARITRGSATVVDWAEEMWAEIDEGAMPPPKPAGGGELSSDQKEKVRNWLACGAPVIPPDTSAPTATWDSIWGQLATSCTGCHSTAAGPTAGMGFVLGDVGDACTSYDNIVSATAVTTACSGMTLVVPSNPTGSLLLQKLKGTQTCGAAMPLGFPMGLEAQNAELVGRIETWIMSGAPKPAGCP